MTYYFPLLFNVPAWQERATQFLFAGVAVTMLAAVLSGSFGVASLITHRFDLRNVIRFLTSLSRVLVVVFCFRFWSPSLWHVAAGFIVSAWVGLVGDLLVWKLLTPQLHIDCHDIDRDRFHALKGLGGWAAVNQIGTLLLLQASLLIVNAMFGAEMTGRYGSMLLFPALIEMTTATVITVLSPAIMARYAVGDIEGMRGIASRSVKLLGLGLALPIGLLCGFCRPLLTLWLGSEFAQQDLLLVLLIGPLTANLAIMPLAYVLTAYNRVKVQGVGYIYCRRRICCFGDSARSLERMGCSGSSGRRRDCDDVQERCVPIELQCGRYGSALVDILCSAYPRSTQYTLYRLGRQIYLATMVADELADPRCVGDHYCRSL